MDDRPTRLILLKISMPGILANHKSILVAR